MDGNQGTHKKRLPQTGPSYISTSQYDEEPLTNEESKSTNLISVEQLQRLVRLLDRSDVAELELKRAGEGIRLVLRKAKASENHGAATVHDLLTGASVDVPITAPKEINHCISAHLVGIFHRSAKAKGGALVAVGDRIKEGQLVATIESLNVINEVESPFAGRVVEILVQERQAVEYGQHLMVIENVEEA